MIQDFVDVIAAIQTINRAIEGVQTAPTAMPAVLNSADLPCALVFVGEFTGTQQAIGLSRVNEQYIVRVYVKPIAQGQGIDEGYQEMLTLLQRFIDQYLTEQQSGGFFSDMVEQLGDFRGNAVPLQFAGVAYHGFEIRLQVVEK